MRVAILGLFVLSCWLVRAQSGTARAAFGRLQKGEFAAARHVLQKSMRKDVGVAQHYSWAWYFIYPENPEFQIDSARAHCQKAQTLWQGLTELSRKGLIRFPIDSVRLLTLAHRIDSLAFERARTENTEAAYNFFLVHFPRASQAGLAAELAAEAGYLQALKQNTIDSYAAYVAHYPEAARAHEAQLRLDKLQFERETRAGTLAAFQRFYRTYPASSLRAEALEKIFQLQTVSGRAADLLAFIQTYPGTKPVGHAAALLFYLDTARQKNKALFPDSLLRLQELNAGYWVPCLRGGKFGFLNHRGEVVMTERFTEIPMAYRCWPVTSDFITADAQVFLRNGKLLAREAVTQVDEIGGGFVLMYMDGSNRILHKTGLTFLSDVEAAKWIANQFLAVRLHGRWGIFSINGLPLVAAEFEDIDAAQHVIVFHRNGKRVLVPAGDLPLIAEGQPLNLDRVFDDIKAWGHGRWWVKNGSLEGVLNDRLQFELPLGRQRLTRTSFGHLQSVAGRTTVAGLGEVLSGQTFHRVVVADPWLVLQSATSRAVYSIPAKKYLAHGLDSVWFSGKNAWALRSDSTFLFAATRLVTSYPRGTALEFIPSADSVRTFFLPDKNTKTVYELATGKKRFAAAFDKIQQAAGFFVVTLKNKRGLLDANGKTVLPPEYDEIVFQPPFLFSLVKNKTFGWYDGDLKKLTKPVYDRNVQFLGADLLVTGLHGKKGVLLRTGDVVFPFELEEVRQWTDSLIWIRKSQNWQLVAWRTGKVLYDRVRSFQTLYESINETCVLIKRDAGEGVFSSLRGELIPPTFTEVMNVGDERTPLYLAAKNVEEAGIVAVAYFDKYGRLVRRQAYENDEIEQLICEDE